MSYSMLEKVYGGSDFFNKFKNAITDLGSTAASALGVGQDLVPCAKSIIKYGAPLLGLGGDMEGGCNTCGEDCSGEQMQGAAMINKRRLRDRLM